MLRQCITLSVEPESRCWGPLIQEASHEINTLGVFTLETDDDRIQQLALNIGPRIAIAFAGGFEHSFGAS